MKMMIQKLSKIIGCRMLEELDSNYEKSRMNISTYKVKCAATGGNEVRLRIRLSTEKINWKIFTGKHDDDSHWKVRKVLLPLSAIL